MLLPFNWPSPAPTFLLCSHCPPARAWGSQPGVCHWIRDRTATGTHRRLCTDTETCHPSWKWQQCPSPCGVLSHETITLGNGFKATAWAWLSDLQSLPNVLRRWLHLNSSLSLSRKSLLFLAVMLYKVHKNTGLMNTVLKGRFPWASGHNTFVNQSTHSLVLCVFLFKDIVLTVCCWLIDMNSWWTAR